MVDRWLLPLVGTLVTAVATAGIVWLRETIQRRDREHRRSRAVAQATQELALIGAWLNAHERLRTLELQSNLAQRVWRDMEKAYSVLAEPVIAEAIAEPVAVEPRRTRWSVSSFFLRDLTRGRAKAARVAYYVLLVQAAYLAAIGFVIPAQEGVDAATIIGAVFVVLIGALPPWGAYKLARWLDRAEVGAAEPRLGVPG
jgi:hypothetical protein